MAGLDRCDDAMYKREWMEQKCGMEGKKRKEKTIDEIEKK